jgi:hypothetical protein
MKKLTLVVLALGLTFGAFAQNNVAKKDVNANFRAMGKISSLNSPKDQTLYPSSIGSCATVDSITWYTGNGYIYGAITGTNAYKDTKYAQLYNLSSAVTVKGVAAYMCGYEYQTAPTTCKVFMNSATSTSIGNELTSVSYSTDALQDFQSGLNMETFTFPTTQTAQTFAVGVEVPLFSYVTVIDTTTDSTGATVYDTSANITCNFAIVGSTPLDCYTENGSWSYSLGSDGSTYAWTTISAAWNGSANIDLAVFPICEGTVGLSQVELNKLTYVYPNPAKEQVVLASSFTMNRVEICNMLGQTVYSANVSGNATTVNTANYAKGNYIVKMYTDNGMATKKIVVE